MRTTNTLRLFIPLLSLSLLGAATIVPSDLGWVVDVQNSMCSGHFSDLGIASSPLQNAITTAKAKTGTIDLKSGRSLLKGQVQVVQGGQQADADQATVYRKEGKITRIDVDGHVRLKQNGRLLLGDSARLDLVKQNADIHNAWYRYTNLQTKLTAWGFAKQIQIQGRNRYDIADATYSTCAPTHRIWRITAKEMVIEHDKGRGVARHAKLWLGDWPLVYLPYFSFASNSQRKSGFLVPSFSYTSELGSQFTLPFYWNIAPNYDGTLTTQWSEDRGVSFNQEFRYLSKQSHAKVLLNYAPDDTVFQQFQQDNPGVHGHGKQRGSFHLDQGTVWSSALSTDLNINAVSDDYFLQEYHSDLATVTARHLLRLGQVNYLGEYWQVNAKLQDYQTLEPLDQTEVTPVYALLPQITLLGEAPIWHGLIGGGQTQFTHFSWPNHSFEVNGKRTVILPYLNNPLYFNQGNVIPQLSLHATHYELRDTSPYQPTSKLRLIPMMQLDSQLHWLREIQWQHARYTQTLEPRVLLLSVPYQNQNNLPLFDTTLERFTYDSVWRTNRFNGDDRIGDAQQIALGVQSRWLTADGQERLRISSGVIHYFHDRRVGFCQTPDCVAPGSKDDLTYVSRTSANSPVASLVEWHVHPRWRLQADMAADTDHIALNNAAIRAQYHAADHRIINFGYLLQQNVLTRGLNGTHRLEKDHLIGASAAIPFSSGWQWLGGFSYNLISHLPQTMLIGTEYDSCCWALRVVGTRTQNGLRSDQSGLYNNSFFFQLLLKGLGSVSNASPEAVLVTGIPGYRDAFNQRGII